MKTTYIKFSEFSEVKGKMVETVYSVTRVTKSEALVAILASHSLKNIDGTCNRNSSIQLRMSSAKEYKKHRCAQLSQYAYLKNLARRCSNGD